MTCERVRERLDAFMDGTLSDEEFLGLMSHVDRCPDCAMLLRVQQHTSEVPTDALEASVPNELVDGMYRQVMGRIKGQERERSKPRIRRPSVKWLVPALSTAVAVLLLANGATLHELRRSRERESALSERIEGGRIGSRPHSGSRSWTRELARPDGVSIVRLRSILERMPPKTRIVGADEAVRLLSNAERWRLSEWDEALTMIDPYDGLQANEILRLIGTIDPDPNMRIPTARLVSLSKGIASDPRGLIDRKAW
jgi:hypothetical protein